MFVTAVLTALCLCWARAGGVRPPPLSVARCCPAGHELSAEVLRLTALPRDQVLAACKPAAADAPWAPRIYAPARAAYLERGYLPAHWTLTDAVLPDCPELRVLPEHAAPYALLANNGSLLLRSGGGALPPARYCGDAGGALVCADHHHAPPPVAYKCCGKTEAVEGARCIQDQERARIALEELHALASGPEAPDVALGWPVCAEGSRYAEAGALRGAHLDSNGSLELAAAGSHAVLAVGAWCADGVRGATYADVRVFACEVAARSDGTTPVRHALYGAGLAVGAAFLAATLAAGFALPAAHHALHWRCQTYYVAALMLGDVLLAATQLAGDAVPPILCRSLGECRGAGRRPSPGALDDANTKVYLVLHVRRSSGVHALPVPLRLLLAEHDVLQYLVDVPVSYHARIT